MWWQGKGYLTNDEILEALGLNLESDRDQLINSILISLKLVRLNSQQSTSDFSNDSIFNFVLALLRSRGLISFTLTGGYVLNLKKEFWDRL